MSERRGLIARLILVLQARFVCVPARMSIDALEALLEREEDYDVAILPSGAIVAAHRTAKKPLTMRENLGGEYAA